MQRKEPVPDSVLTQRISQQLSNRGMRAPCKINVQAQRGTVTLSGQIQYEHQRRTAVQAARGIEGVQRIVDHLTVMAGTSRWG